MPATTTDKVQSDQYYPQRSSVLPLAMDAALEASKSKPKIKRSFSSPNPDLTSHHRRKKRKHEDSDKQDEKATKRVKYDPNRTEDKDDTATGRTRSQHPKRSMLEIPHHSKRSKFYPSYTPWGWYGMFPDCNNLYPKGQLFEWDNSDVSEFDLGEALDEMNFWEGPWMKTTEERKRKRQQTCGGLTAAGRKRAYKKRTGVVGKMGSLESWKIIRGKATHLFRLECIS